MTLAVGSLLQDNRYQIQTVLNATDIEIVYQAIHTYLNRTVILKQLRHDVDWAVSVPPTGRAVMARLLRLSQCQHPCLGEVLDCFEEDSRVYLVLPAPRGLTLSKWLQTNGPVQPLDMLSHLRSLIDIFDKFHQNGLIYGHLSPHVLHYRTETNEMVVSDISWRMFLWDLLGDRHCLNYSKTLDLQRLAYISYCFLTGDYSPVSGLVSENMHPSSQEESEDKQNRTWHDPISVPKLSLVRHTTNQAVEAVISSALSPQTARSLTPTDWFIALEQSLCSGPEPDQADVSISALSRPKRWFKFNILWPQLGESGPSDGVVSATNHPVKNQRNTKGFLGASGASGAEVLTQTSIKDADLNASTLANASTPAVLLTEHGHDDGIDSPPLSHGLIDKGTEEDALALSHGLVDEGAEDASALSHELTDEDSEEESYGVALNPHRQHGTRWSHIKRGLPLLLSTTAIVGAISGGVLGYVFRIHDVEQLEQSPFFGNEIFGSDQDFPPSEHWPGLSIQVDANPTVFFERLPRQQGVQSPPKEEGDVLFSDGGPDVDSSAASRLPVSGAVPLNSNEVAASEQTRDDGGSEAVTRGPLRTPLDGNASPELVDERYSPESTPPQKTPKPSAQPQAQPPTPSVRARPTSPTVQPESTRVNELPPSSGSSSPGQPSSERPSLPSESNPVPLSNPGPPNQAPIKRPKVLITPVFPSGQSQSVDRDGADV